MLNVHAVLETSDTTDFPLWPVADLPPWRFMALSGRMSPLEVGTALATLADYNSRAGDDDRPVTDAGEAIRRLLRVDRVVAPGGLRVHDTRTDVTVTPGCCCGLEDWRAWLDVADGDSPWLGHDPSPWLEHADGVVRLWPDGGDAQEAPSGDSIEIVVGDLPQILHSVQEGLNGFLTLAEQWATRRVPTLAADLAARLDEDLTISAPLPGDYGRHAL
ncbi:hypothetical protein OHB54_03095 [Streptomyces sp. NBC_01007]|nr:hypothetical protein OHB54_03095 [Streptomyces sp. NBC_01007]